MRDVTGSDNNPSSFGQKVRNVANYILQFLRHPIQEIAHLPDWHWQTLFWVQIIFAIISGFIAGLTKPGFFSILAGIIVTPFASTLMELLLTAFLYYYFQVFEKRTVGATRLFALSVFASIPFFIFQVASSMIPPITLVGFAFSAMLLAVGLSENFQMEKRRAVRLALILFAIVMLVWLGNKLNNYRMERAANQQQMPLDD